VDPGEWWEEVYLSRVGATGAGRLLGAPGTASPLSAEPAGRGRIAEIFTGNRELTGLLPAVDLLGVAAALRAGLKLLFEPAAPD
jgi:hypothetical protein